MSDTVLTKALPQATCGSCTLWWILAVCALPAAAHVLLLGGYLEGSWQEMQTILVGEIGAYIGATECQESNCFV